MCLALISAAAPVVAGYYQAAVAKNNAQIADYNVKDTKAAGAAAVDQSQTRTAQTIGGERAGFSASGIDPNFGTAVDVQSDTAKLGALDALTIRQNYLKQAYGYQVQAISDRAEGKSDIAQGYFGGFSSLMSSASQAASKWGPMMAGG